MKIHEEQASNKSKATCGYCREEGHNQYQCPHVRGDWENFLSRLEIPKDKHGHPIKRGYNYATWRAEDFDPLKMDINNNALSSWFRNCKKAYIVQKERGFEFENKVKRGLSTVKSCGFCGSKDHTRRNCTQMEQFLKDCYKANENWRRIAYHELVEKGGLSVGACVEVTVKGGWNQPDSTAIGIIKSIGWDTVNVFSAMKNRSDFAHSPLNVEVLVNGEAKTLHSLNTRFKCLGENGSHRYYWHGECSLNKVITHSPTPLPAEWITSYKESFETLVKKRTLDQLKNGMKSDYNAPNLVAHIDAWK